MQNRATKRARKRSKVIISVNPKAGHGPSRQLAQRLADLLLDDGFEVEILEILDEVAKSANLWHKQGLLWVLVGVGGDGTAAELVNRTEPGVPIVILPSGTENLLAKYIGWSQSPEELYQTIVAGRLKVFDAARADERIFLLMIGCGFDADVVRRVDAARTGHITHWTYFWPILTALSHYRYPKLLVYSSQNDDGEYEDSMPVARIRWLFAFNLPCYAGGLKFTPGASGDDGFLDVCTFRRGSFWHWLRYMTAILFGRHHMLADCNVWRTRRFKITSPKKVPYQLDGDPGGYLPVKVEIMPKRMTLMVPQSRWPESKCPDSTCNGKQDEETADKGEKV
ncbi:MAG: hypothetical protein JXM70_30275 [Pirellulales bacterium]|nr:hypothetical protein [Pirellulales bacterium]